jgi:hypothetical protein
MLVFPLPWLESIASSQDIRIVCAGMNNMMTMVGVWLASDQISPQMDDARCQDHLNEHVCQ